MYYNVIRTVVTIRYFVKKELQSKERYDNISFVDCNNADVAELADALDSKSSGSSRAGSSPAIGIHRKAVTL